MASAKFNYVTALSDNIPQYYNLVDDNPLCAGTGRCANNSNTASGTYFDQNEGIHTTLKERQMLTITNMARQDQIGFKESYGLEININSICIRNPLVPYEWETNLQQSAKKLAEMRYTVGNCGHSTCEEMAYLFGGSTSASERVAYYDTYMSAEGILGGKKNSETMPQGAMSGYMGGGHCAVGFGIYNRFYVNVFNNKPHQYNNPLKSGAHWAKDREDALYDYIIGDNSIHFIANYFSDYYDASSVRVVMDGVGTSMTLLGGNATNGAYNTDVMVDGSVNADCPLYYFEVTNVNGDVYKLPEQGSFIVNDIATCNSIHTFQFDDGS
eukprot:Pgem_evm1s3461